MAVFQPLYFSGGRYSAGVDRILLASLVAPETSGARSSGVIPANFGTKSLKVTNSSGLGRTLSISQGLCIIQDATTPSVDSPGAYLGGIDSSTESVVIANNAGGSARVDSIYAVVDETAYTIINKKLDSGVVTLTTSSAHGFKAGQTVVVTGVDSRFDGSHVIATTPTSTEFTYTGVGTLSSGALLDVRAEAYVGDATNGIKSAVLTNKLLASNKATLTTSAAHNFSVGEIVTVKGVDGTFDGTYEIKAVTTVSPHTFSYGKISPNITSAAIANSYSTSAVARVPFAIKVEEAGGTTLSGKTKIKLATVSVPGSNASDIPAANVTDTREFVSLFGGIQYYNSTAVDNSLYPAAGTGKVRFDVATNSYQIYNSVGSAWRSILHTEGTSGTVTATAAEINHIDGVTSPIQAQLDLKAPLNPITNAQTGSNYDLVLADNGKYVEMNNASANTVTVPLNSAHAFPIGAQITIVQTGAGPTTITSTAGVTVNFFSLTGAATPIIKGQWAAATLVKRATNTWVLIGNLG